jgi:hypothetical protein
LSAFRLHLRLSGLSCAVLPLTILALLLLLARSRYWVGVWPEAGAAAQAPAYFLSAFAAAAAAWLASAPRRHGQEEQLAVAARSPSVRDGLSLAAVLFVMLVPYAAGQAVAAVMTVGNQPPGVWLWLGYATMGAVTIALGASWGWLVGKISSGIYGALTAGLSWLLFETFVGDTTALGVVSGPVWQQPDLGSLATRAAAAMLLGVAAVTLRRPSPGRLPVRPSLALPSLALVFAAYAVMGTSGVSDRVAPAERLCVDGRIEVCLWPEHAKYLPMVQEISARAGRLPPPIQLPAHVNEYGLVQTTYSFGGRTFTRKEGIDISEGNRWAFASGLSEAIVAETFNDCERQAFADRRPESVRRWMELTLAGGSTPDYRVSGVPQEILESWDRAKEIFDGRSPTEQASWAAETTRAVRAEHCGD